MFFIGLTVGEMPFAFAEKSMIYRKTFVNLHVMVGCRDAQYLAEIVNRLGAGI